MKHGNEALPRSGITPPPRPLGALAALGAALWLTACGGGGGNSPTPSPPPPPPPPAVTTLPDLDIVAPAQGDLGAAVAISTSATPAAALKVQWDFGDGTTATDVAPQHQFARAGDLTVKLTLTNEAGTQKTYSKAISLTNKALVKGNSCSGGDDTGWCWMPPQQSGGNPVNQIFFANPTTGWRVGDFGEIFKTTDGAQTWVRQASGSTAKLDQIIVRSSNEALAVGTASQTLLITADGGQTWKKQTVPGAGNIHLLASSRVLVVPPTSATAAFYLDDVAGTWRTMDLGAYEQILVLVDGSVLTYAQGKFTRRATPTAAPETVFNLPPLEVASTLDRVAMNRTSDQVVFVTRTYIPPSPGAPDKPPVLLYRSVDGGRQWQSIKPTATDFGALWTLGGGLGDPRPFYSDESGQNVAMMSWGYGDLSQRREESLWTSNDGGATWKARLLGDVYNPYNCGAWGLRITCDGRYGGFTSADFGATWTPTYQAVQYSGFVNRLRPAGGALVINQLGVWYAVSYDTQVWRSLTTALPGTTPSFATRKMGRRVLNGSVYGTEDGGRSWTELGRLATRDGKDVLALRADTSLAWTATLLGSAAMLDERTTFLVSSSVVVVSRDGGTTWTRPAELNVYGTTITQVGFQEAMWGWAIGFQNATTKLLTTRDGGNSWQTVDFLPTSDIVSARLGTGQQVTAIGKDGSVYQSANGGTTWSNPGNISAPITDFSVSQDGAAFWATGAAGSVFKSTDKGASWQKMQLSTTADLLAVCFADGSNGWVSGKAGELWATRNGGTTWRRQTVPASQDLKALSCQDSRTAWVAGAAGLLATGTGGE